MGMGVKILVWEGACISSSSDQPNCGGDMKAFWWLAVCAVVIINVHGCGRSAEKKFTEKYSIETSAITGDYNYDKLSGVYTHVNTLANTPIALKFTIFDVVIIGGGLQLITILAQFGRYNGKKDGHRLHLGAIEKRRNIGPGFPYSRNVVRDSHITNTFQSGIDVTTTDEVTVSDFETWLGEVHPDEVLKGDDTFIKRPRRNRVGDYLKARFVTFLAKCNNKGYQISLLGGKEATGATKVDDTRHVFEVKLHSGEIVKTKDLFLATGHWPWNRLGEHIEGFYPTPWPASTLEKNITLKKTGRPEADDAEEHIGTLGSSLNSIDATMTVTGMCGEFVEVKTRDPIITTVVYRLSKKKNCRKFRITMYSRSAQLPQVRGYIPKKSQVRHVNESEILDITREAGNDNFLPLKRLFDIVREALEKEEEHMAPGSKTSITKATGYDQIKTKGPLELLKHIEKTMYSSPDLDGGQKLKEDIERAEKTLREPKTAIPLQTVLYYSLLFFNLYAKYYSLGDTLKFKNVIGPKLFKYALTIPLENARKMYALYNQGYLDFKILVNICTLQKRKDGKPGIQLMYKDSVKDKDPKLITHNHFIDATGQLGDIEKDESDLTQSLLKGGFIQPLYVRYKSREEAEKFIKEEEEARNEAEDTEEDEVDDEEDENDELQDSRMCRPNEDLVYREYLKKYDEDESDPKLQYYRKVQGIKMDMQTYQAIPTWRDKAATGDRGAIYASGPYVYGYYPIAQSLYINVYIAELAVLDILIRHGLIEKPTESTAIKAGLFR